jgi:hypothetical protein
VKDRFSRNQTGRSRSTSVSGRVGPRIVKQRKHQSLFGSFSSEKEQESSFSEEKEAKRLLFLV